MNPDLYINERPIDEGGSAEGGGGAPSWSGPSGSGPAWGGGEGTEDTPEWVYKDLSAKADYDALRSSAGGRLMQDDPRGLICCAQLCPYIPPILVYIRGDEGENTAAHSRCVLIQLAYRDNCGRYVYENVPLDAIGFAGEWEKKEGATVAWFGGFLLCEPEESVDVFARWQGGHFDHKTIREMRIFLFGVDLGWRVMPLNGWKRVATVTVDETFHIRSNGFWAKLAGNREELLNDAEY